MVRPSGSVSRSPGCWLPRRARSAAECRARARHRSAVADRGIGIVDDERHRRRETGRERHGAYDRHTTSRRGTIRKQSTTGTRRAHEQFVDRPRACCSRRSTERCRAGGDFAEVFVEDRRSSSARFDDGTVEELVLGRDRGAGIRVVRGETTGFAHTADLSPEGLRPRRRGGRGGRGERRWRRRSRRRAQPPDSATVAERRRDRAGDRPQGAEGRAAAAGRRRRRGQGGAITSVTASLRRRPPAHRRCQLRRPARRRRPGAHAHDGAVRRHRRHRHADRATRAPGRTMGFELFDTVTPRPWSAAPRHRPRSGCSTRPGTDGRIPVVLRRGAGGVLFHEACGHGLEADHIYKDASVFSGDLGELVAVAVGHARRRRHVWP